MDTTKNYNDDFVKFQKAMNLLFSTPNGEIVLEGWKKMYVETSALADTELKTGYLLGQKELIQSIDIDSKRKVEELK